MGPRPRARPARSGRADATGRRRPRAGGRDIQLAGRRPGAPGLVRGAAVDMIRVAILADYLEEGWPSMDLVADMLLQHLQQEHAATIAPVLVRPPMPRRVSGGTPGPA